MHITSKPEKKLAQTNAGVRKNEAKAWIKKNTSRDNLRIALRTAIGIILSVIIAKAAGLQFAASTCIITMLGIQSTKRDTLRTAVQRIVSLAFTLAIAILVETVVGPSLMAFCISVTVLALITFVIGWNPTLSINVVVLVHLFLQNEPFTGALIGNEIIRVLIGLSIALVINWRMPNKENEFRKDMKDIEQKMQSILNSAACILRGAEADKAETAKAVSELDNCLKKGMNNAYIFANNNLSSHAKYYMDYISLRESESMIISNVCSYAGQIEICDETTGVLADLVDGIAHCIALEHPLDVLAETHKRLETAIDSEPLPQNKTELKNRAIVYFIKGSLDEMLGQKQSFIDEITDEERSRYWTEEHR